MQGLILEGDVATMAETLLKAIKTCDFDSTFRLKKRVAKALNGVGWESGLVS